MHPSTLLGKLSGRVTSPERVQRKSFHKLHLLLAIGAFVGCTAASEPPASEPDASVDVLGEDSEGQGDVALDSTEPKSGDIHGVTDTVQPSGEIVSFRELAYPLSEGLESDLATLDIHRMDDGEARPVVLLVHGGSWAGGDKAGFEAKIVPWWIEQGYVAVPVNFRLATKHGQSPAVKPRDQANDIAAAIAWLKENAATYQMDTSRTVLLGYSSGAHLVALLGTDESIAQSAGVDETHLIAAISLDVHAYDVPYALELMVGSVVEGNTSTIAHLFGQTKEQQLKDSPISYVDGWATKALIISVDKDPAVPGTHGYIVDKAANHYVSVLVAAGHTASNMHDISETHSSLVGGFGEPGDKTTEAVAEFIATLP